MTPAEYHPFSFSDTLTQCSLSFTSLSSTSSSHFLSACLPYKYCVLSHLFSFRYRRYVHISLLIYSWILPQSSALPLYSQEVRQQRGCYWTHHPQWAPLLPYLCLPNCCPVSCERQKRPSFHCLYSSLHHGTDLIALTTQIACNCIFLKSHGHIPWDLKLHASPRILPCCWATARQLGRRGREKNQLCIFSYS